MCGMLCEFRRQKGALFGERSARCRVDMLEQLERIDFGRPRHALSGPGGEVLGRLGDIGTLRVRQRAFRYQVLLEALDRIATLPELNLAGITIAARVIRIGVRFHSVGESLDQRRPAPVAGVLDRRRDDRVHCSDVVAVDVVARHPVTDGLVSDRAAVHLLVQRHTDGELIVLHEEHHGRLPDRGKVERLVGITFTCRAVAEQGQCDRAILLELGGGGETDGMQRLRGEWSGLGGNVVLVVVIATVPITTKRRQDVLGSHAPGEEGNAVPVGRKQPVICREGGYCRDLASFLAEGRRICSQAPLSSQRGHL